MWNKIIEELKKSESEKLITAFISPLKLVLEDENRIVIGCPNKQILDSLERYGYKDKIKQISKEILHNKIKIEFIIKTSESIQEILPLKKSENSQKKIKQSTKMYPYYTFENFIPGPSNMSVFAASQSIAKNPGINYNPFFVYGETGLGKTHIVQSIGNSLKNNKKMAVCYITSQQLLNEYISALSNHTINEFREDILKYDTLIVDDIQFLEGKKSTQNEFFYIFNQYHSDSKQIVITSDRYPSEIKDIDDRLKSRFSMGVTLEVKPPEYETRVAIVKKKAQLMKIDISEEAIEFIAKNMKNNVREIEGALKTIKISSDFVGKEFIDLSFAQEVLKDMIKHKTDITVNDIIKMTSSYFKIRPSDITSQKRSKQISTCRQISIYLAKKYTNTILKEIGKKFGNRNHSTILSSISKIEALRLEDTGINKIIEKLEREIEDSKQ